MVPKLYAKLMTTSIDDTACTVSTLAAGVAAFGIVDTKGYDFACVLYPGYAATAADTPDQIQIGHDDTVATAFTDSTALTQFTGGTAVATNVGFVRRAQSSTLPNMNQFNVDLRGLKRYLTIAFECDCTHAGMPIAVLGKKDEWVEPSSVATTSVGMRNFVSG
ncbi:MAG: hypothetical protein WC455_26555 [Dehalococcoidia bacterium]